MKNKILYGDKQLPALLDTLQDAFPLRHRELHLEHHYGSDQQSEQSEVSVCGSGHVHFLIASLCPVNVMTLMGLYAYTLALILDAKKEVPRRPKQERSQRIMQAVMEELADYDPAVAHAYVSQAQLLWHWLNQHSGEVAALADYEDTSVPLVGALGLPIVAGEG